MNCSKCEKHLLLCKCVPIEERIQDMLDIPTLSFLGAQYQAAYEYYKTLEPTVDIYDRLKKLMSHKKGDIIVRQRSSFPANAVGLRVKRLTKKKREQLKDAGFNVYPSSKFPGMTSIAKSCLLEGEDV